MALSANVEQPERAGAIILYKVKAATRIYKGAVVCTDSSGYLVPAADTSGLRFVGVADEAGDNAAGASGAISVRVKKRGLFAATVSGWNQNTTGAPLYATADDTVATSSTNSILVGYGVEYAGGGKVLLRIDNAVK